MSFIYTDFYSQQKTHSMIQLKKACSSTLYST